MSRIAINDTEQELIRLWRILNQSKRTQILDLCAVSAQRVLNDVNRTPQIRSTPCKIIPFKPRTTN
jgi:hypothetical protein